MCRTILVMKTAFLVSPVPQRQPVATLLADSSESCILKMCFIALPG